MSAAANDLVVQIALVVVGLIHAPPVLGVLGRARLAQLYAIDVAGDDLLVLMRHRAMLFAVVAVVCFAGAFVPAYRMLALVVGALSIVPFLVLARGPRTPALRRVVVADGVALAALVVAALAMTLAPSS